VTAALAVSTQADPRSVPGQAGIDRHPHLASTASGRLRQPMGCGGESRMGISVAVRKGQAAGDAPPLEVEMLLQWAHERRLGAVLRMARSGCIPLPAMHNALGPLAFRSGRGPAGNGPSSAACGPMELCTEQDPS